MRVEWWLGVMMTPAMMTRMYADILSKLAVADTRSVPLLSMANSNAYEM